VQGGSADLKASYHYEAGGAESLDVASLKIHSSHSPLARSRAGAYEPWISLPELDVGARRSIWRGGGSRCTS